MHDKRMRSAGEIAFNGGMFVLSLVLLVAAYAISGFESLSSPGALPMAVALAMVVSSGLILLDNVRNSRRDGTRFIRDILPPAVIVMMLFVAGYAVLLVPLGFLPTSLLFLALSIIYLRRGGIAYALTVSLVALLLVYVVFRLVFTVLMPAGIVPEAEILAAIGRMFGGAE
ncbi:tripartite tricarboxylate transporter TctB family protein [Paracoccus spongiarum]|uniref:Tripartite tricarboxylate transporter TctB family protein n=1 Tax=Paracoccus spongiarum TaxID=3064387 RepID=A0ABT9JC29_9RHOB|nr:tripartite tricarboxylate transporter TctB family protein [Paracoccus sp. 2205BS29-5]MDP5307375.1 tripartite tricarboxylate transporter TctB family protein [Paracoccus sp. 2205BS29-5]